MKGYAKPLHEFISRQQIQFVIPVYQRNYDWRIDNCNQLFSDLVKLSRSDRHSHFFGSIVTSAAGSGFNRFVIDGQQRLTSLFILLNCLGYDVPNTLTFACRGKSKNTLSCRSELEKHCLRRTRKKDDIDSCCSENQ